MKRRGLDLGDNLGQQVESRGNRRRRQALDRCLGPLHQPRQHDDVHDGEWRERPGGATGQRIRHPAKKREGENDSDGANGAGHGGRGLRPCEQLLRQQSPRTRCRIHGGDSLAQVELRSQCRDTRLALADIIGCGRARQPGRQPFFANRCPGAGDQIKQAADTKDIQVIGIQMVAVTKALARRAGPDPAILDAGNTIGIERDGRSRAHERPDHQLVPDREGDKCDDSCAHEDRAGVALNCDRPIDQHEDEDGDLGIAKRDVRPLARSRHGLPLG